SNLRTFADAVEDPCRRRIVARVHARVPARDATTFGGVSNSRETVGKLAPVAPEASRLAGRAVVQLARLRFPGARAGVAAPDLDEVASLGVAALPPEDPVPAEVHQPAAAVNPGLKALKHGRRAVLRMSPSQHHPVLIEEPPPVSVEIPVTDDVVVEALL